MNDQVVIVWDKIDCIVRCQIYTCVGDAILESDGEYYDVVQCCSCGRVWLERPRGSMVVIEGMVK